MLDGFPNKAAEAICIYALMGLNGRQRPKKQQAETDGNDEPPSLPCLVDGKTVLFFRGLARGCIVEPSRADLSMGWGWDPIFKEERSQKTFAMLGPDKKSKFSHRGNALKVLRAFLDTGA
jgi:hypothetical protein